MFIYILSPLFKKKKNSFLSSGAFKLSGYGATFPMRLKVHVLNSQSVLESGWFFPFDGKLMAQPWALVLQEKT